MGIFSEFAVVPQNKNWEQLIARNGQLDDRPGDVRSPFARDYTRILHSRGFRRMKHKTQVFFNIDKDHICTRMEHVTHVESVSGTIAGNLGLNTELTKAISIGHDIGHAPFGHHGERVLDQISRKYLGESFWHEKNGLHFVDDVELLANSYNEMKNLGLTYAVRDGIISHCGELDQNGLHPRNELIDLSDFQEPGQYQPATWEGCVVKIADKIAYVGRDIEDAISLGFIDEEGKQQLLKLARANDERVMNTTVIMYNLIQDICENSSPEKGICLSDKFSRQLDEIKEFNLKYIYRNKRFLPYQEYSELLINQIFESLYDLYDPVHIWENLAEEKVYRPDTIESFEGWLAEYCKAIYVPDGSLKDRANACKNRKIYGTLETKELYVSAIIDYISGMTDRYAIKVFNELLKY
ncbi:MAG: HD domain-containing protein [Parasporobacterium sp.]|nr:HD domain-containing protein [Parasporobacterium sp.]